MTRRITTRWHMPARLLALAAVAVLLAGCFKFDSDLTVSSDDTISGTIIMGFDRGLLEMGGGSLDDLMGSGLEPVPDDVEGITAEEWEDDDFIGQQYTLDAIPLEEFNADGEAGELQIVRDGDVFRLSGDMDMSAGMEDLGAGEDLGMDPSLLMGSAELSISVTFPGEVLETNGTVEGTTVTWEPEIGGTNEIMAVAEAEPSSGAGSLLWILLVVAFLVVLAIVAFVVFRRRSEATTVTAEAPVVGAAATSQASTAIPKPGMAPTGDGGTTPPPPGTTDGPTTTAPPDMPPPPSGSDDTSEVPDERDATTPMPPPPPPS